MTMGIVATGLSAAAAAKSLMSKPGGGGGSSASKDPWGPVAPWLENNVEKGEQLQNAYEAQPFNQLQMTAYQNAFGDIDNYRQNLMPALMQQAAKGIPGFQLPASYSGAAMQGGGGPSGFMTVGGQGQGGQRQQFSPEQQAIAGQFMRDNIDNPGLIKQQAAKYGLSNADLLGAAQTVDPNIAMNQVDQFMGRQDPMYARPAFGLIDWNTVAPRARPIAPPAPAAPGTETEEQRRRREEEEAYLQYMDRTSAGAGTGGE